MDVQQKPIFQFLEGSSKNFVIPVYQRDYAWTVGNCQKLWSDLVDLTNNSRVDHFLGTIVTIGNSVAESQTVIDGQQRLTTVSILLKSLHHYLEVKQDKQDIEKTIQEQILNEFLINKYSTDKSQKIRLKPNKQDRIFFERLFDGTDIGADSDSNIITNFNFFFRRSVKVTLLLSKFFKHLNALKLFKYT